MHWSSLYFAAALCCFQASSETLRYQEDHTIVPRDTESDHTRIPRDSDKDHLALSREIFRNITKQLRQSIAAKDITQSGHEKLDHLLQNKIEEHRFHVPHQSLHHHEHHWGPYFEGVTGVEAERPIQVTGHVGSEALLSCRVGMLKDKTVMWLRRAADAVQLLTVGSSAYSGDNRVGIKFQYPNNWRLSIDPVRRTDAGLYMCQISTHPPRAILANLTVLAPILTINGDQSHEVKDRYYKTGSSIELSCVIAQSFAPNLILTTQTTTTITPSTTTTPTTTTTTTESVTRTSYVNRIDLLVNRSWSVETTTLSSTVSISTVKLKSTKATTLAPVTTTAAAVVDNVFGLVWKKQGKELVSGVTMANISSTFVVASATQNDSGIYSCHLPNRATASVNVHVLIIGENQAAVHHDTWNKGSLFWKPHIPVFMAILLAISYTYGVIELY